MCVCVFANMYAYACQQRRRTGRHAAAINRAQQWAARKIPRDPRVSPCATCRSAVHVAWFAGCLAATMISVSEPVSSCSRAGARCSATVPSDADMSCSVLTTLVLSLGGAAASESILPLQMMIDDVTYLLGEWTDQRGSAVRAMGAGQSSECCAEGLSDFQKLKLKARWAHGSRMRTPITTSCRAALDAHWLSVRVELVVV